jgi:hypothetical protein
MLWLVPIAATLLIIQRIRFPEARKSFISGLFLLALASMIQFQNCGDTGGGAEFDMDNSTDTGDYRDAKYCASAEGRKDPNCPNYDESCVLNPYSINCQAYKNKPACIQLGQEMSVADPDSYYYLPPCDLDAGFCPSTGTVEYPEDCP